MIRSNKGDTIIEVMFATAVASLVIVLSMAVMNRGVATTQMAIEHTFVRQGIDGQAEALRYLRDNQNDTINNTAVAWDRILSPTYLQTTNDAQDFGTCSFQPGKAFYIDTNENNPTTMVKNASINVSGEVFATAGRGMWVEAISSSGSKFVDFHIRACWDPPFSGPKATMGTIVRLNK